MVKTGLFGHGTEVRRLVPSIKRHGRGWYGDEGGLPQCTSEEQGRSVKRVDISCGLTVPEGLSCVEIAGGHEYFQEKPQVAWWSKP